MLSSEEKKEIDKRINIIPLRGSVCIEAMKIIQEHRGWINDDSLRDLAGYLDMSVDELDSIASFYSLLFRRPVGRHVILVCDSVSCWIMGYPSVMKYLQENLGISPGETTSDGSFTLLTVPCLGLCEEAPAMIIDAEPYTLLTPEKIDRILEEIRQKD